MRLIALILVVVLAPVVLAHPLDDRAQMASEVVIASDSRLEYVIDFRYVDVLASYAEFSGGGTGRGLDADEDGYVSRAELKRRYNDLVDQLLFALAISVDGEVISLQPDFDRFVFENMNDPGAIDMTEPVATDTIRIHYRFVFSWDAPAPLTPGNHSVDYYFNGLQSVIHTPSEQMIAFDARVTPRQRLTDVTYDDAMGAIPRLVFNWGIDKPARPAEVQPKTTPPPDNTSTPEPVTSLPAPTGVAELPAWLTLIAGGVLALFGLFSTARNAVRPPTGKSRGRGVFGGLLFVIAGAAIVLGACVRLGLLLR